MSETPAPPEGLLAELTHRCPLACPYCSNPVALDGARDEMSTQEWKRIFSQSAKGGIQHYFVEQDEPADAFASIRNSFKFLRALRF